MAQQQTDKQNSWRGEKQKPTALRRTGSRSSKSRRVAKPDEPNRELAEAVVKEMDQFDLTGFKDACQEIKAQVTKLAEDFQTKVKIYQISKYDANGKPLYQVINGKKYLVPDSFSREASPEEQIRNEIGRIQSLEKRLSELATMMEQFKDTSLTPSQRIMQFERMKNALEQTIGTVPGIGQNALERKISSYGGSLADILNRLETDPELQSVVSTSLESFRKPLVTLRQSLSGKNLKANDLQLTRREKIARWTAQKWSELSNGATTLTSGVTTSITDVRTSIAGIRSSISASIGKVITLESYPIDGSLDRLGGGASLATVAGELEPQTAAHIRVERPQKVETVRHPDTTEGNALAAVHAFDSELQSSVEAAYLDSVEDIQSKEVRIAQFIATPERPIRFRLKLAVALGRKKGARLVEEYHQAENERREVVAKVRDELQGQVFEVTDELKKNGRSIIAAGIPEDIDMSKLFDFNELRKRIYNRAKLQNGGNTLLRKAKAEDALGRTIKEVRLDSERSIQFVGGNEIVLRRGDERIRLKYRGDGSIRAYQTRAGESEELLGKSGNTWTPDAEKIARRFLEGRDLKITGIKKREKKHEWIRIPEKDFLKRNMVNNAKAPKAAVKARELVATG